MKKIGGKKLDSLNTIIVEGNVVKEPLVKKTQKGTDVCSFSIMTTRSFKKEEGYEKEISFFDVDAWGKLAISCEKNLHKGRGVRVVGRAKQNRWVGADGKKFAKVNIVAEHIEFRPMFMENKNQQVNTSQNMAQFASNVLMPAEEALVF